MTMITTPSGRLVELECRPWCGGGHTENAIPDNTVHISEIAGLNLRGADGRWISVEMNIAGNCRPDGTLGAVTFDVDVSGDRCVQITDLDGIDRLAAELAHAQETVSRLREVCAEAWAATEVSAAA